jgi:hypothetical protein
MPVPNMYNNKWGPRQMKYIKAQRIHLENTCTPNRNTLVSLLYCTTRLSGIVQWATDLSPSHSTADYLDTQTTRSAVNIISERQNGCGLRRMTLRCSTLQKLRCIPTTFHACNVETVFLSRVRFPASRTALGPTQLPIQWVARALSLEVKQPRREADHSPPSSAEVKEWVELYLHSPIRLHGLMLSSAQGQLYFTLLQTTAYR